MKRQTLNTLFASAATLCLIAATSQEAKAFTLGKWTYARDSFTDSTAFASSNKNSPLYNTTAVGGTAFEIYGIAFSQVGNTVFIAINANMGREGWTTTDDRVPKNTVGANKGIRNIGWGDLIFNFSGKPTFAEANPNQLFGVRFAYGSDSKLTVDGLYKNITTTSVTNINSGWSSFKSYNDYVSTHLGTQKLTGGNKNTPSLGHLAANSPYFDQTKAAPTTIASGVKVANDNFTLLDEAALIAQGLNFTEGLKAGSTPIGSHTFGFSFTRTEEMKGNFIAHLFAECANDGVAIEGEMVPEPMTILGTTLAGFGLLGAKLRKRRQAAS